MLLLVRMLQYTNGILSSVLVKLHTCIYCVYTIHSLSGVETEFCRCPDNYTGVDCSVSTSCGDNCEDHEMCIESSPYPECKGKCILL